MHIHYAHACTHLSTYTHIYACVGIDTLIWHMIYTYKHKYITYICMYMHMGRVVCVVCPMLSFCPLS